MAVVDVHDLGVALTDSGEDIVTEINLTIETGKVLGLVGESGSGKSTVATALLGYARAGAKIVNGRVAIDGRDMRELSSEQLRALRGKVIAYVPQDPSAALNPSLRLRRQLSEMLTVHAPEASAEERDRRMGEALAEVRLPSDAAFLKRYPHQISGGQQQRLTLAMAFILRPRVIVLDEPTTGLDVSTQAHILTTVRDLCHTYDVAALYVSHDLAVVAGIADRVVVLYAGRVVEAGETGAVFAAPAHPYTQKLLAAIPSVTETRLLEPIPGHAPAPGARPFGCPFAPRCPYAIEECRVRMPVLEEVAPRHLVRCVRFDEIAAAGHRSHLRAEMDPTEGEPLLEMEDVHASYGQNVVLRGVSLTVRENECVALVGESGSGKTTAARCIAGLDVKWQGQIRFRGDPLPPRARARSTDSRRRMQYLFQSPYNALHPRRSIQETVATPLRHFFQLSRRETHARVIEAIEDVALPREVMSAYPHELSGGERQRVALARALVCDPDLLICDEITSALDVSVQAAIIRMLDELRLKRSLAMLFVTHDIALVRSFAERMAVLQDGRIVEVGQVGAVLDAPDAPYTRLLVDSTPKLSTDVRSTSTPKLSTDVNHMSTPELDADVNHMETH